jgi:hypothetical protein
MNLHSSQNSAPEVIHSIPNVHERKKERKKEREKERQTERGIGNLQKPDFLTFVSCRKKKRI